MAEQEDNRVWAILSEEEKVIALSIARTPGGALRRYEERTGKTRDGLHVEDVEFVKGCHVFICAT